MEVRRPTVLYVDEDSGQHAAREAALSSRGVMVRSAQHNGSAVAAFSRADERPDIVVLDLTAPGMSAFDAYMAMRETDAALPVLFVSGGVEDCLGVISRLSNLPRGTHWRFLAKPFTHEQLARCIDALLRDAAGSPVGAS